MRGIAWWWLPLVVAILAGACDRAKAEPSDNDLRTILALDGWDQAAWAEFDQGEPASDAELARLLKLLRRIRSFDAMSIARWSNHDLSIDDIVAAPQRYRARLVRLEGRLKRLDRRELSDDETDRLGFSAYYLAEVHFDNAAATVLTADVPRAWLRAEVLHEPVSLAGLAVKQTSAGDSTPRLLLVAPRIAWHPTTLVGANQRFGWAVLGTAGFDVGLLDGIVNRRRIRPVEREAFYQILAAACKMNPQRLTHHAEQDLPRVAEHWESLVQSPDELLARTVLDRVAEGRYSVAPLFNDADNQHGNLVVLEGVARRCVKVDVGQLPDGRQSDVWRRFAIDHYYELDVFTDDSQNYPVIFCAGELPAGFPTGASIREPVRVAGFFFKSWLHHVRQGAGDEPEGGSQQQFAPLLVSPGPLWMRQSEPPASIVPELIGGGLFVLALLALWGLVAWQGRHDRRFRAASIESQYALPTDRSLDDIIPDGVGEPDFSDWSPDSKPHD